MKALASFDKNRRDCTSDDDEMMIRWLLASLARYLKIRNIPIYW
jgi:hypothetical protein